MLIWYTFSSSEPGNRIHYQSLTQLIWCSPGSRTFHFLQKNWLKQNQTMQSFFVCLSVINRCLPPPDRLCNRPCLSWAVGVCLSAALQDEFLSNFFQTLYDYWHLLCKKKNWLNFGVDRVQDGQIATTFAFPSKYAARDLLFSLTVTSWSLHIAYRPYRGSLEVCNLVINCVII